MAFGFPCLRQRRSTGRLFFNVTLFVVLMTIIYFVCLFSAGGHLKLVAVQNFHVKWEQKRRNLTIEEVCKKMQDGGPLGESQLEYTFQHVIVDDRHKLLYCYVPKVACSNWKRVFQVLSGKYKKVEDILKLDHNDFKFLSDYSPHEIEHKLQNYFKFLFVRNPVDRLVSAFQNKFRNDVDFQRQYGRSIVFKYRENPPPNPLGDDVTLEEFLQYLSDLLPEEMNEHWRSYESLCQPCHIKYNFIGKFEYLGLETGYLLESLGLEETVHFPAKQRYYKDGAQEGNSPGDTAVDDDEILPAVWSKVIEKFKNDFDLFDYPVPHVQEK